LTEFNYRTKRAKRRVKWYANLRGTSTDALLQNVEIWEEHRMTMRFAGYPNPERTVAERETGDDGIYVTLDDHNRIETVFCKDGGEMTVYQAQLLGKKETYGV